MIDTCDLESKARALLGWDGPGIQAAAAPLTDEERAFMVKDAYDLSPSYPADEAPATDVELCRWWLAAMRDYVDM